MKRYHVFSHLNAEKSDLYRSILSEFRRAKESFRLHLRPRDLSLALGLSEEELTAALQALVGWGNLTSLSDTADVATVEDFYRPRYLFQLSAEGEAMERALLLFEETVAQPGELQALALLDIRDQLKVLLEEGDTYLALTTLSDRFQQLTARAQAFMGGLQRGAQLLGLSTENLLLYKERVIEYLERFIGQLVSISAEIVRLLQQLDDARIQSLLDQAARREAQDSLLPEEAFRTNQAVWQRRWEGLCNWFRGRDGQRSQAEILRSSARSAITSLLTALSTANDRRAGKSDRFADLCQLARWFAESSEPQAQRLWRAAFGLSPSRHLYTRPEHLPSPASTPWAKADPVPMSVRLRKTGTHAKKGAPQKVVDRSQAKRALAHWAEEQAGQFEKARQILANGQRLRLSQLGSLEPEHFQWLLDLLGDVLAERQSPTHPVETFSADGSLRLLLEPAEGQAVLRTSYGQLMGQDHFLTIETVL